MKEAFSRAVNLALATILMVVTAVVLLAVDRFRDGTEATF